MMKIQMKQKFHQKMLFSAIMGELSVVLSKVGSQGIPESHLHWAQPYSVPQPRH